jgi:peptidoglycan/xylan/chitin deacetylase (PgdA/CDA1 family)
MRFKPPKLLRRIVPDLVWNIPDREHVYLTFDDGPTPGVTEWILKELERFGAKATFFCLGKNVEMYPDIYQRIVDAGHKVGNHSYSHQKGWEMKSERYVEDVDFGNQFTHSDLFRPPYGRISPKQARELGRRYNIIMWSVLSRDYNRNLAPRTCLNNVIKHVCAGDIVVFHDSEKAFKNLHFALPRTLKFLQDHGMTSKPIEL